MSINYVIATWSGARSREVDDGDKWYIQHHLDQLSKLKHNLSQITIGYPENPDEPKEYTQYISGLRDLQGVPVKVLRTENQGWSYGQYSAVFKTYGEEFENYLFIEDDYIPVIDDFDQKLLDILTLTSCDYLCSLFVTKQILRYKRSVVGKPRKKINESISWMAVTNGVCKSSTLSKIWTQGKRTPFDSSKYGGQSQMKFSDTFVKSGCFVKDFTSWYSATYMNHEAGSIDVYGNKGRIFDPIQILWAKIPFVFKEHYENPVDTPAA